jgi:hypothetical protein
VYVFLLETCERHGSFGSKWATTKRLESKIDVYFYTGQNKYTYMTHVKKESLFIYVSNVSN